MLCVIFSVIFAKGAHYGWLVRALIHTFYIFVMQPAIHSVYVEHSLVSVDGD